VGNRWARRALYALATSDQVERLAMGRPRLQAGAYRAAGRYVAGATLEDAVRTVERLRRDGLAASVDLFGEGVAGPEEAERVVGGYLAATAALGHLGADAYLEVVPSHLGLDVSVDLCRRQAERIVAALPAGSRLEVSAEESWRTGRIMELTLALAGAGAPLVATVQANLLRSPGDAERLAEAGVPVRLVKGAYLEPPAVAHPWGDATDLAYLRLAHRLGRDGVALSLGTHDPVLRESLLLALPAVGVEMLLGVRPEDASDLVRRGVHVRVYVPYGDRWFRYWLRRVAEARGA
jgi:proline dehydrogenase